VAGTPLPRLSGPARRALATAGIRTLEELAERPKAEIEALHGMGPNALGVLGEALRAHGLRFGS
jgi:hypothetical protein